MTLSRSPRRWISVPSDWALGGLGISMATASASFAAYMIATAPAEVVGFGSKDFKIFTHWDRRPQALAAGHARPTSPAAAAAPTLAAASPPAPVPGLAANDIDLEPTGSIPVGKNQPRPTEAAGTLDDFHLREVFGDHALIEHSSRLTLVKPGSILAGAGEVLAIERHDRGWVVRTAAGTIGGN